MNTVGFGWARPAVFQVGRGKTLQIPMEVHASSRAKLIDLIRGAPYNLTHGILLVKGGEEQSVYDTDGEPLFRQDSWFNYLFGVKEPGVFGALDIATNQATLFIPKLPQEYAIWCGAIHPPSIFASSYAIETVLYTESLLPFLRDRLAALGADAKVYVLHGRNSDSGLFPKSDFLKEMAVSASASVLSADDAASDKDIFDVSRIDASTALFYHALSTARVTKSAREIEVMRYCALVASNAHVAVMRATQEGMIEYQLEATFLYEIYRNGGCRRAAYTSICACGPNGAVLHYGHAAAPNDRPLEAGDMALLDMGAEYHGYVSDITCSFPVSGRFSDDQRAIYLGVLAAQREVLAAMRPGASWPALHKAAELEILKALQACGVLVSVLMGSEDKAVSAEELAGLGIGGVFFPHGLGHLIGCDTHDVGGYLDGTPERLVGPGVSKLRTARTLEANMVLTNEPGCYFIAPLLDAALANASIKDYFNVDVLDRFRGFGGVRLEDVVLVTDQGAENLTTCPRTIAEVESVCNGGAWPPARDEAPWLLRRWTKLSDGGAGMTFFDLPPQ